MIKEISKGKSLLVIGPARVMILEGKMEVFGKIFPSTEKSPVEGSESKEEDKIIIPSANTYPLFALENSKLEIYTNSEENINLINANSIPKEWIEIKDSLLELIIKKKENLPLRIMVLGISSGKTTLIKYLANNFFRAGLQGGYLDSDLGQQIIYLPTTINIGAINNSIVSSADLNVELTAFIGATFPKGNYKFIVSYSCKKIIEDFFKKNKETKYILIDTDGWVKQGETSITYKNFFIETVDPDVIIIFDDGTIEELKKIEENALKIRKDRKLFLIKEKNEYYYEKNKDERRFLRQSRFSRVFEEFRKISIPLDNIKFIKYDFDEESNGIIEREIDLNNLINLPYHYVIIALMTEDSEIIKIGLLFSINIEKNYILLFSDINFKEQVRVKKILLGSLRLSTKGNHQGYLYL